MSASGSNRYTPDEDRSKTPAGERQDEHQEEELDEALEESFPASDPPSPARPLQHPGGKPERG